MAYDHSANYEIVDIEELPHGEIMTTLGGEAVHVQRPGGRARFRITLRGHYMSFSSGVYKVGDTVTVHGIEFVVNLIKRGGMSKIKGIDGEFFDGRLYELQAISTTAHDTTVLDSLFAGE